MNLVMMAREDEFIQAYRMALSVLHNETFWHAIRQKQKFDLTEISSQEIADLLLNTNHPINIFSWKPTWLQSKFKYKTTNAITVSKDTIRLNVRKKWRELDEIAGTIIHEGIHAIDKAHANKKFGHGDNSPIGKEETAPFWIANLAIAILRNTYDPNSKLLNILNDED